MDNASISIEGNTYRVLDVIEKISIADSFVLKNKTGGGHGEARLYIGSQKAEINFDEFFEGFQKKCFFLKSDLVSYLNQSKTEYIEQEQDYNIDISKDWPVYYKEIENLKEEKLEFRLESANGAEDKSRYYVRSGDDIYTLMRKISLPFISYISILKIEDENGETFFYFHLFLDNAYDQSHHPAREIDIKKEIQEDTGLDVTEKQQITKARVGQGKFRSDLLEEIAQCIFTKVNDERLLIASHIKPWNDSNNEERIDHYNGIPLTPTYDKLFDQGFITFRDDGTMIVSPYLSPLNVKRLLLIHGKKYDIPDLEKRAKYLEFHRENRFKA
jgi:predicted restriction endonuclease